MRLLLALVLCAPSFAQLNCSGGCAGTGGGGSNVTELQALSTRATSLAALKNVVSGSVLVVCISWFGGANTTSSLADTLSTSWTQVTETTGNTGQNIALYVGTTSSGGADTFTGTFPAAAGFQGVSYEEFLGSTVTATVDASGSVSTTGAQTAAAIQLSTAKDGDVIVFCADNGSNTTVMLGATSTPLSGFANSSDSGFVSHIIQPKHAASTWMPISTGGSATGWGTAAVALVAK